MIEITGKQIVELAEKAALDGQEMLVIQDGNGSKKVKASAVKAFSQPDLSGYDTREQAEQKYQPAGDYLTEVPQGYVTETELDRKGFATQEYVDGKVAGIVSSAPETLDTLNELASALGDDPNFASTVSTLIGTKLSTEDYNKDKALFALKTEIPDISGLLPKNEASQSYQPKLVEVDHGTSDTVFTLTPNTYHKWGEVTALTLTFGAGGSGMVNEYLFEFKSGATATVLSLPGSVKFIGNGTVEPNKTYQVSVINGLAVMGGV